MAGVHAVAAGNLRPADMSPADEQRIRLVASRVTSSSFAAKYQHELAERSRHNFHFLFLDPSHPWHRYYQHCLHQFSRYTIEEWQQYRRAEEEFARSELERRAERETATSLLKNSAGADDQA
jgi:hypothetical protein